MNEKASRRISRLERTLEEKQAERRRRRRFAGALTLALFFLLLFGSGILLVLYRMEENTQYFTRHFPQLAGYLPAFWAD